MRTLRDNQQFSDPDDVAKNLGVPESIWPLFGVIWDSSRLLARLMQTFDIADKRILEVGCGVGLASLMLNSRAANITATDHHPEAQAYLQLNALLNAGEQIPFVRTDWHDEEFTLGKFDLIVGSDILYQPDHAELLSEFIDRHANKHCEVIIVDPSRGNYGKFGKAMVKLGYVQSDIERAPFIAEDETYTGQIRRYIR